MSQKLYFLKGLPGSGKSTLAKEMLELDSNMIRVNHDSLEQSLWFGKYIQVNRKFDEQIEEYIVNKALIEGKNVVVDNTHISSRHLDRFKKIIDDIDRYKKNISDKIELVIIDFTDCSSNYYVSVDECIRRDSLRDSKERVGKDVILKMAAGLKQAVKPRISREDINYLEHDPNLPNCIIYDIDGTVSITGNRNPYDASKALEVDKPNKTVIDVILSYFHHTNTSLFAMTGREEKHRKVTSDFICKKTPLGEVTLNLFMRKDGDYRGDEIVKKELYEKYIKGKFNVLVVFDDRNKVVDMWRKEGIHCFQVEPGDF